MEWLMQQELLLKITTGFSAANPVTTSIVMKFEKVGKCEYVCFEACEVS